VALIALSGSNVGEIYSLSRPTIVVGRNDDCHVQIIDDDVSRRHALLNHNVATGTFSLTDLGSANGTSVNGAPIEGKYELKPGDKVKVGYTVLRVSMAGDPELQYARTMQRAALRDPAIGVFNLRYLEEELWRELRSVKPGALSIILLSVDGFQELSERLGSADAELLLAAMCRRIEVLLDSNKVLARSGPSELMTLCRGLDEPAAFALGNRIRTAIEETPLSVDTSPIEVKVSTGVVAASPQRNTPMLLITAAQACLRAAHSRGGNTTVIHSAVEDASRCGTS